MITGSTSWEPVVSAGMLSVGLFAANGHLAMQLVAAVAAAAFSFMRSIAILKLIDGAIVLRVAQEEEATGLDLTQHNERAHS
jgi:Amt family ammonium transporter